MSCFFLEKIFSLDFYLSWKVRPNSAKWIYGPLPLLISGTHMSGLSIEVSGRIYSGNPTSRNECKNGRQTFGKMSFLDSTMRTRYNLWIIREKTEPLVWMYYQLFTVVTLKKKVKVCISIVESINISSLLSQYLPFFYISHLVIQGWRLVLKSGGSQHLIAMQRGQI